MWEKERYHSDNKYRLRKIAQTRKYMLTKKGKIAVRKSQLNSIKSGYRQKWQRDNPEYYSIYMATKRMEASKKGICQRCFKNKVIKGLTVCRTCRR